MSETPYELAREHNKQLRELLRKTNKDLIEARKIAEELWEEAEDHNGHCGGMPIAKLPWKK